MYRKLICSICVVVVLGLVGSASAFQVVDDFEGGNLNIWEITEGQAAVAIGPDPTNPSNNCLVFSPETITMRTPWGLLEGEAEMLSYRLMYDKQADGTVTLIFGVSDPDGTAWGNYYALARMNSYGDPANIPDMDVRDGGAYTDVVQADLEPLRWYDVLLDIDTTSKKYDLYIDGVLVFQGAAFRSGYSPANLEYIILKTTTWENNFANGTVYVDDIVLGEPPVTIPVLNAGFEDPVLAEDDWSWLDVPGWTWVGGEGPGIWHVTSADFDPVVAPEGQNVLYTENAVGDAGGVAQVLTDTFAANMDYTLTVEVGNSYYYFNAGYSVQLLAGGVVIAEDNDTLWPDYYKWATSTVEYTYDPADAALVGQPLEIRLLNLALDKDSPPAGEVVGVEFDNVTLSYVPEPAG